MEDSDLGEGLLATYNINTLQVQEYVTVTLCLQVILNDFRERIERYNGELVKVDYVTSSASSGSAASDLLAADVDRERRASARAGGGHDGHRGSQWIEGVVENTS